MNEEHLGDSNSALSPDFGQKAHFADCTRATRPGALEGSLPPGPMTPGWSVSMEWKRPAVALIAPD